MHKKKIKEFKHFDINPKDSNVENKEQKSYKTNRKQIAK